MTSRRIPRFAMQSRRLLAVAGLAIFSTLSAGAADWPGFRGPGGLGEAADKNLPITWGPEANITWKTQLPGAGASSPIVVGDKVFLTCYTGYGLDATNPGDQADLKRHVLCLDRASGKLLWKKEVTAALPESAYGGAYITKHGYASSTPAADQQHLFIFFGKSGVFAFDHDGKQLWQASVGTKTHGWGSGTSPVLHKDLVIVNASVESGSLVALRKGDGTVAWKAGGMDMSWNTPLLVDVPDGRTELVVSVRGRLRAFNPDTGKPLWNCEGIQDYVCPSIIAHDGVVYAIGGRSQPGLAVRAGGKGDVSETHVLWRLNRGSNVSSPVYHDGYLYWAHEQRGTVYCVDARKGTVVYEKRLEPGPGLIYASPVVGDGKVYFVSREQGAYVIAAKPEFKQLAHNTLDADAGIFNASPVVSNGQLLLRSDHYLYCIGKKP
jgi:outer membrane protein assembly factor BamB